VGVYFEPDSPLVDRNLIRGLMSTPATMKQSPEENQVSEVLAWLVNRSPTFAGAFVALFFDEGSDGVDAAASATRYAATTRTKLPPVSGFGALYPDLSIVGDSRSFQLLVEVKVEADFHINSGPTGDLQHVEAYATAWGMVKGGGEASVRGVGTLSRTPPTTRPLASLRVRDVAWDEVQTLLGRLAAAGELDLDVRVVAADFAEVVSQRVMPPPQQAPGRVAAGLHEIGPDVVDRVVSAVAAVGATPRNTTRVEFDYVGRYVSLHSPDGVEFELWVVVTPQGARYNLPGWPCCISARIGATGADGGLGPLAPERLEAAGFEYAKDIAKYAGYRTMMPIDLDDTAAATATTFADDLVRALRECPEPLLPLVPLSK
jgi:hypothetical protein